MTRWLGLILLGPLFGFCPLGCASTSWPALTATHPGPQARAYQARAEAVCAMIRPSMDGPSPVAVLDADTACAYAMPSGNLYVTRGLMDVLDDQELAAALAHEMGHLLNDGHLRAAVSLRGCCQDPDREARADATGAEILRARGLSRALMIRMLRKVQACPSSDLACRSGLERRIRLLAPPAPKAPQNFTAAATSISRSAGN